MATAKMCMPLELIDHAGVLHALVLVSVARRIVEPRPREQATVPVVGGGEVVHLPVRHRLALLHGLNVGAAVVDGRPRPRAHPLREPTQPAPSPPPPAACS